MKKHILFFTLALLLIMPSTLFAVDANTKGYIEGSAGFGIGESSSTATSKTNRLKFKIKTKPVNGSTEVGFYINENVSLGISLAYTTFTLRQSGTGEAQNSGSDTGTDIATIRKFSPFINVAYHYNINDKLGFFASPAIGFGGNSIAYKADKDEDDFTDVAKIFTFGTSLTLGGIYNLKNNLYLKADVNYNYSTAMFDGPLAADYDYNGNGHMWAQLDVGFGKRF